MPIFNVGSSLQILYDHPKTSRSHEEKHICKPM